MASVKVGVRDKGWTAWTVWSKDIHDKFEIQFQNNHRMFSKLYIATMIRDKVNMTPIPSQLLFPQEQTNNLPFLLSQVKRMGTFNLDSLDVELEEMKYAENADSTEAAIWSLKVHKQFGRILLNVLNVDDYLIIWGGLINPELKEVVLNATDTPACFVTIYRHNGIHTPTPKSHGQYENSCCKENVDTMFFKGTTGEDVTIVQKIEPKSTLGTTWKELTLAEVEQSTVMETENVETEAQNVAGPSLRLRTPKLEPNILRKTKPQTNKRSKRTRNGSKTERKNTPVTRTNSDMDIDLVDLADDDSNSRSEVFVVPPAATTEESKSEAVDVIADQEPEDRDLDNMETNGQEVPPPQSVVSSQTSEEDFPFPVVREPRTRKQSLVPVQESEEIVLYDDTDDEFEHDAENITPSIAIIPLEPVKSAASDASTAVTGNGTDEDLEEPEIVELEVEDPNESVEPPPSEPSTVSAPGTPPDKADRIAQEVAKLCAPPPEEMELDELESDSEPARTNAKLLKNIIKFPGSQLLSQDVMVVPESQLFNEIEELDSSLEISSEAEVSLNPPSEQVSISDLQVEEDDVEEVEIDEAEETAVQNDKDQTQTPVKDDDIEEVEVLEVGVVSIEEAGKDLKTIEENEKVDLEKEMIALHESDVSSDDSEEFNSDVTSTSVVSHAELKQLYDIKGATSFHFLGKIHEIHEVRGKNQVILRVSDGTLPPFVTRRGFPLPPGVDVGQTLQADILVQNCTQEFRRKLKLASQKSDENVVLSYVFVAKLNRKEYALTMDMKLSSDINFGDTVPQDSDAEKRDDFPKPKAAFAKEDSKSIKEKPNPVFNKPGSSSKSISFDKPEPVNVVSNGISETPQVEPSTVTHAKRRLTFDHPAPSTSRAVIDKENIDAEVLKKFGCHPVTLKVMQLRDIPTDKPIILDDTFYKNHPDVSRELLVPIEPQANARSDVSRSPAKQAKKAVKILPSAAGEKKKRSGTISDSSDEYSNSSDEEQVKSLRLMAERMNIPLEPPGSESEDNQSYVEDEPPAKSKAGPKSRNKVGNRTSPTKPESCHAVPSPTKNRKEESSDSEEEKPLSSTDSDDSQFGSRKAKNAKARELILTSSDSESEPESLKKGRKRSPPKKAQNGKSKGKLRVPSESESEESDLVEPDSPPPARSSPKKSAKTTIKAVESESESEDESYKSEPKSKARTTRQGAALNAKGKKPVEVFDVSDDSESEKSDSPEPKSKRSTRSSPVKKTNVNANNKVKKTRKAPEASDSDQSGSPERETKRAPKRARVAPKSPKSPPKSPPKVVTRTLRSRK